MKIFPLSLLAAVLALFLTGCDVAETPNTQNNPAETMTAIPIITPIFTVIPTNKPTATIQSTETAVPSPSVTAVYITGAALNLVSETVPDGAQYQAGERFVKSWTVRNSGIKAWTQDYVLKKVSSSPQGETLGSPQNITLPGQVNPGQEVQLSVELTAPGEDGRYTVFYRLEDQDGNRVANSEIWVSIIVGNVIPAVSGSETIQGVSAELQSFTPGDQNSSASFCLSLPNRNYGPLGGAVSMTIDNKVIAAESGRMTSTYCYLFNFPVSMDEVNRAEHVFVSVSQVGLFSGVNYPDEKCEAAKVKLATQYPGLDFTCHFSRAGYFTDLKLPENMTYEEASRIIINSIEDVMTGPWVMTIK